MVFKHDETDIERELRSASERAEEIANDPDDPYRHARAYGLLKTAVNDALNRLAWNREAEELQ